MLETIKKENLELLEKIDYKAFAEEIKQIRNEINDAIGEEDFKHLLKIETWGKICSLLGYATAWIVPNPISAFLISQGNVVRWTMITHHISHKGYDKVPNIPTRYTSKGFAKGMRRLLDWFDWMYPEAWANEHNLLHHYHTGEVYDPDLVERNLQIIRDAHVPMLVKYLAVGFFMCTWKLTYYAPNTLAILQKVQKANNKVKRNELGAEIDYKGTGSFMLLFPFSKEGLEFWEKCLLPYGTIRFIAIPALFLPISNFAAFSVLVNSIMAEIMTNIHSFIIITPNHTGEDVYKFEKKVSDQAEFFVRQVAGSVNFKTGGDFNDFLHGWLNYQIEHHVFPDIPMLKYQQFQPKIKAVCEKYGVPYIQENVFTRFLKCINVMVGNTSMKKGKTLARLER